MEATNTNPNRARNGQSKFDWIILPVVVAILGAISFLLFQNIARSQHAYEIGLNAALQQTPKDYNAILALSRASDIAVTKSASMFIGFLFTFTGALFLFKVFNASYKLGFENEKTGKVILTSSSPGLVMATLGTVLVIASISQQSSIVYHAPSLAEHVESTSDTAGPTAGIQPADSPAKVVSLPAGTRNRVSGKRPANPGTDYQASNGGSVAIMDTAAAPPEHK